MKEIFDWLREQMEEISYEEEDYFSNSFLVIDSEDAIEKVNEAEAKWEAECCEQWDLQKDATFVPIHSIFYLVDEAKYWKFCPHCGKPIKISEV